MKATRLLFTALMLRLVQALSRLKVGYGHAPLAPVKL